jgi:hypothetical protein
MDLTGAPGHATDHVRDAGVPGLIRGLDGVALAFTVIGIVLTWLPANQRFASDLKVGRRS